ncbi:hypothetical protein [Aureimonas sp. D3]|uniref:hypothetical protein n=1 Tax=Aureimonas sp. D3 TaxID=1638164 RepID=UPI001AEC3A4A|nr:hypothetical protein [Aureimonas sp. D3]
MSDTRNAAHRVSIDSVGFRALVSLVDSICLRLGHKPRDVSGDTGFADETNLPTRQLHRATHLAAGQS